MTNQMTGESPTAEVDARPNGGAWAALLSAAIGGAAFGLLTDASECSARVAKMLNWYNPSGALSGVAISAILVWVITWILLRAKLGNKRLTNQWMPMAMTVFLVLVAIVTTFPPFYELFAKGG
jgi:hypothetical protein